MKRILSLTMFLTCATTALAQIVYQISDRINYADLRVQVGQEVDHPDIRIRVGTGLEDMDFTAGITTDKSLATFVITTAPYADVIIRAGEDVGFPDIRVLAGEDVDQPDAWIEIKTTGTVDYAIYTEKDSLTFTELITALLPAVNRHIKVPNEKLTRIFGD